jgi:hypothetical protein
LKIGLDKLSLKIEDAMKRDKTETEKFKVLSDLQKE